jgi:hypothetical protein
MPNEFQPTKQIAKKYVTKKSEVHAKTDDPMLLVCFVDSIEYANGNAKLL